LYLVYTKEVVIVPNLTRRNVHVADFAGIGAVILAAGASTRMGRPKQLLQFCGQTLVRRGASVAVEAGCRPVVVVTGAHAVATRDALSGLDVQEAENQQWPSGISSSIRVGVEAVVRASPQTAAIILMLCDQPFVTQELIARIVAAHRETGRSIIASRYGGSYGVPALFGKKYFAQLTALEDALGAKRLIQKQIADVQLVDFPQGEIDIDTPDDLSRLN
jgi:molybdenum cofactor cytidylyltransferase